MPPQGPPLTEGQLESSKIEKQLKAFRELLRMLQSRQIHRISQLENIIAKLIKDLESLE